MCGALPPLPIRLHCVAITDKNNFTYLLMKLVLLAQFFGKQSSNLKQQSLVQNVFSFYTHFYLLHGDRRPDKITCKTSHEYDTAINMGTTGRYTIIVLKRIKARDTRHKRLGSKNHYPCWVQMFYSALHIQTFITSVLLSKKQTCNNHTKQVEFRAH